MTRPVTAICNQCDYITDINYKEKIHPNNIKETYFKCEKCFYHYTCFVKDIKVRKLQRKIGDLKGLHKASKRLELQNQINNRMAILKDNLILYGRADL